MTIDRVALEQQSSPAILLASGQTIKGAQALAGVGGFDAFGRVYVQVVVPALARKTISGELAVKIESSPDGETWTQQGEDLVFARDGAASLTIDTPDAQLRARWTVNAGFKQASLLGIFATPGSLDNPTNGGSVPDSFLASFVANSAALTGSYADVVYDFPADASMGADLTLSDDGTTFTVVTAGMYGIIALFNITPDANTALGLVGAQMNTGGLDSGDLLSQVGPMNAVVPLSGAISTSAITVALTIPPTTFKAGDTFTMQAREFLTVGAAHLTSGSVSVIRTA